MPKRKGLSKKVRFEVFKRDKFTCQYCGAAAPDVLLHIDHIDPVASGGGDEIVNLVTACASCNSGKGAVPLADGSAVQKSRAQLAELEEKRQQLKMMLDWKRGLADIETQTVEQLAAYWSEVAPGFSLTPAGKDNLRRYLSKYPADEVATAMSQAIKRYLLRDNSGQPTTNSVATAFKKIPGFAWTNKQRRVEPDIDRLFYIRGILRKRTGDKRYLEDHYIDDLRAMRNAGYSIEEIETAAKTINSDLDYCEWAENWTKGGTPQ